MIPYGRQSIDQADIDAVVSVLQSDFITQGPKVPEFEEAIQKYCDVKYAVACNSATSCLHIACLALGLGPGDYFWTTPISFVASANCAIYCGAQVDFVDIDPDTFNMSVAALEQKLKEAHKQNKLPKIICPVHLAGQSCDMKSIHTLAQQYGIRIIEDASHAIGGRYENKKIGDCRYSDITVFSFHPVKIITTAEGGIATTHDKNLMRRMQMYRSHGITKDEIEFDNKDMPCWYYEQQMLGFNYRMNDIQAALGISQLKKIEGFIEKRHEIAKIYNEAFKVGKVKSHFQMQDTYSAYHLYIVQFENQNLRDKKFVELRDKGVGVNLHYYPIHLQPYYRKLGHKVGDYPNAEKYYRSALSLPIYAKLTNEEIKNISKILK